MQTAQVEVRRLLDQIRVLSANPVIQRASDQIEVLCSAYMEADQSTFGQTLGLRKNQAIIFDLLHKRAGCLVSRTALHNACTRNADCDADVKTLDVQICKIRQKLIGSIYEGAIEAVWGVGYRLNKPKAMVSYPLRQDCPRGHAYDAANTYVTPKGTRKCRKCRTDWKRSRRRAELKAKAA